MSFVCVGTPSLKNGKLDLSHIESVAREIWSGDPAEERSTRFVLRSTVLAGTTEGVVLPILEKESGKQCGRDFTVCYNPEFMREGSAVADFLNRRIRFWAKRHQSSGAAARMYKDTPATLYETHDSGRGDGEVFFKLLPTFESRIRERNGNDVQALGVDAQTVTKIFTSDTKLNISPAYLSPGFAFGGSCLPKDLRAIDLQGEGTRSETAAAGIAHAQQAEHVDRASKWCWTRVKRKLAQLGLSFKAGTDDLREARKCS